jgi:hypothetical protein
MTDNTVLDSLFAAIVAGDLTRVRACFTPSAQVWHGYDCVSYDVDSFIASLEPIVAAGLKLRYDDVRRQQTPTGFVQQYLLVLPSAEGGWTAKPCCAIAHLQDGLIEKIHEYVDRTGVFKVSSLPALTPGI